MEKCWHEFRFNTLCGCKVCIICGYHEGLARCYCGWSLSGGNGYRELLEIGEGIERDY